MPHLHKAQNRKLQCRQSKKTSTGRQKVDRPKRSFKVPKFDRAINFFASPHDILQSLIFKTCTAGQLVFHQPARHWLSPIFKSCTARQPICFLSERLLPKDLQVVAKVFCGTIIASFAFRSTKQLA